MVIVHINLEFVYFSAMLCEKQTLYLKLMNIYIKLIIKDNSEFIESVK
jgi:hypothetical protein